MFDQHLAREIKTFLAHFDGVAAPEENNSTATSFHIYHKIEAAYAHQLSKKAVMGMYYHFTRYEECLQQLKKRDINTGEFLFHKIANQPREFDERVDDGMELLFRAMSAYRFHVNELLDDAVQELEIAISHCERQVFLTPFIVSSIQEQWLNKIRVYFKKQDMELVYKEAEGLLLFTFTGRYQASKPHIEEALVALPAEEQDNMGMHILLNIILGFQRVDKFDQVMQDRILSRLAAYLHLQVDRPRCAKDIYWVMQCLHAYYSNNLSDFVQLFNCHFGSFSTLHKKLQKLLVSQFLDLIKRNEFNLTILDHYASFADRIFEKWGLIYPVIPLVVVE